MLLYVFEWLVGGFLVAMVGVTYWRRAGEVPSVDIVSAVLGAVGAGVLLQALAPAATAADDLVNLGVAASGAALALIAYRSLRSPGWMDERQQPVTPPRSKAP
jgi:hypothetical protein